MRSLQAFTKEVDDIALAVSQLREGIDTSLLMSNTCGIVFCGFEPDMEELVQKLKEVFDFLSMTPMFFYNIDKIDNEKRHYYTKRKCKN